MRITPININQKYQPKFQALKIDPKLSKKLYTETPNFIKRLTEIGTEIAEIKRYNVVEQDLDNILQDAICEKNVNTKLKELLGENYIDPKE